MGTIGAVIIVIVMVALAELFLLVIMPILTNLASTANTTMAATSNLTNYPGAAEGVLAAPWVLYFVIPVIGIVIIILLLRKR